MDKKRLSVEKARWDSLFRAFTENTTVTPSTRRQAIWKRNKATLWYYSPPVKKYDTPLYIIYSLVNKPTILDLLPNTSLMRALTNAGYEVYLIDFGVPGYEDSEMTLDDYVFKYIQPGVKVALEHSKSSDISIMGFCLGGTLAAMYGTIASEPINNLILFVTPIDFSHIPKFDNLHKATKDGTIDISPLIDAMGIIPANIMSYGVRLITSPIYISPYLSLLERGHNHAYEKKWSLFNQWTKDHIPFPGAAFKQLLTDLLVKNKLVKGKLKIGEHSARLNKINANLLVVASTNDELVPLEQSLPILDLIGSTDKEFIQLPNGHTGLVSGSGLPDNLFHWLASRSKPVLLKKRR